MRFILILLTAWIAGEANAADFAFVRIAEQTKTSKAWREAKTLSDRMWALRATALKQATVSSPVSDRYQVTCYGGAIDLVHFLCLAAEVCSGEGVGPRLHKEWVREGGPDHLHGFNFQRPPEAHPDDLPSNALGALFGWEMRPQQHDLSCDLLAAMRRFLAPLIPVPDAVAKQFSHRQIVMGFEVAVCVHQADDLTDGRDLVAHIDIDHIAAHLGDVEEGRPPRKLIAERYGWFTAAPRVECFRLNAVAQKKLGKPLCEPASNGATALAKANLELVHYRKQPIVIRRAPAQ